MSMLTAHRIGEEAGPADYGAGRRCGCGNPLNRYNPGPCDRCWPITQQIGSLFTDNPRIATEQRVWIAVGLMEPAVVPTVVSIAGVSEESVGRLLTRWDGLLTYEVEGGYLRRPEAVMPADWRSRLQAYLFSGINALKDVASCMGSTKSSTKWMLNTLAVERTAKYRDGWKLTPRGRVMLVEKMRLFERFRIEV